jgi:hypothetical protein
MMTVAGIIAAPERPFFITSLNFLVRRYGAICIIITDVAFLTIKKGDRE